MSDNGICREVVAEPGHNLRVSILKIERQLNGDWSVTVGLKGTVLIDATRRLDIDREIHVRAFQKGRKVRRGSGNGR